MKGLISHFSFLFVIGVIFVSHALDKKGDFYIYYNWVSINIMQYGRLGNDLLIICHLYLWKCRPWSPRAGKSYYAATNVFFILC